MRQAPSIGGSLDLCYWANSSGHNRSSRLSAKGVEEGSDQLITVLSAAIFVFVGVDSNQFHYVLDFKVTVQGLVGDVPGGAAGLVGDLPGGAAGLVIDIPGGLLVWLEMYQGGCWFGWRHTRRGC